MSVDSESQSEEERSIFQPFTRESLAAIELRIAQEDEKFKELEKKRAEGEVFCDDGYPSTVIGLIPANCIPSPEQESTALDSVNGNRRKMLLERDAKSQPEQTPVLNIDMTPQNHGNMVLGPNIAGVSNLQQLNIPQSDGSLKTITYQLQRQQPISDTILKIQGINLSEYSAGQSRQPTNQQTNSNVRILTREEADAIKETLFSQMPMTPTSDITKPQILDGWTQGSNYQQKIFRSSPQSEPRQYQYRSEDAYNLIKFSGNSSDDSPSTDVTALTSVIQPQVKTRVLTPQETSDFIRSDSWRQNSMPSTSNTPEKTSLNIRNRFPFSQQFATALTPQEDKNDLWSNIMGQNATTSPTLAQGSNFNKKSEVSEYFPQNIPKQVDGSARTLSTEEIDKIIMSLTQRGPPNGQHNDPKDDISFINKPIENGEFSIEFLNEPGNFMSRTGRNSSTQVRYISSTSGAPAPNTFQTNVQYSNESDKQPQKIRYSQPMPISDIPASAVNDSSYISLDTAPFYAAMKEQAFKQINDSNAEAKEDGPIAQSQFASRMSPYNFKLRPPSLPETTPQALITRDEQNSVSNEETATSQSTAINTMPSKSNPYMSAKKELANAEPSNGRLPPIDVSELITELRKRKPSQGGQRASPIYELPTKNYPRPVNELLSLGSSTRDIDKQSANSLYFNEQADSKPNSSHTLTDLNGVIEAVSPIKTLEKYEHPETKSNHTQSTSADYELTFSGNQTVENESILVEPEKVNLNPIFNFKLPISLKEDELKHDSKADVELMMISEKQTLEPAPILEENTDAKINIPITDSVIKESVSSPVTASTQAFSLKSSSVKQETKAIEGEIRLGTAESEFKFSPADVSVRPEPSSKQTEKPVLTFVENMNVNRKQLAKYEDEGIINFNKPFQVEYEQKLNAQKSENEDAIEFSPARLGTKKLGSTGSLPTNTEHNTAKDSTANRPILTGEDVLQKGLTLRNAFEKATKTVDNALADITPYGSKEGELGKSEEKTTQSNNKSDFATVSINPFEESASSQGTMPTQALNVNNTSTLQQTTHKVAETKSGTTKSDFKTTKPDIDLTMFSGKQTEDAVPILVENKHEVNINNALKDEDEKQVPVTSSINTIVEEDLTFSVSFLNEYISKTEEDEAQTFVADSDTIKQGPKEAIDYNTEILLTPKILSSEDALQKASTTRITISKDIKTLDNALLDTKLYGNKDGGPGQREKEIAAQAQTTSHYLKTNDERLGGPFSNKDTSQTQMQILEKAIIEQTKKPIASEVERDFTGTELKTTLADEEQAISDKRIINVFPISEDQVIVDTLITAKYEDEEITDINQYYEVQNEKVTFSMKNENEDGIQTSDAQPDTTKQDVFTLKNHERKIENEESTPQIFTSDVTLQKSSKSQVTIEKTTETIDDSFTNVELNGNKQVEPGLVEGGEKATQATNPIHSRKNNSDLTDLQVSNHEKLQTQVYSLKGSYIKQDRRPTKGEIVSNTKETNFKPTPANVGLAISAGEKNELGQITQQNKKKNTNQTANYDDEVINNINKPFEVKYEEISLSQKTENEGGFEISVARSDKTKQSSTELTFINSEHNNEKEDPTPQILISDVTSQKSLTSQVTIEKATETLGYSFEDVELSGNKEVEPELVELEEEKAILATWTANYHKNYDDVPELPVSSQETSPTPIYSLKDTNIKHDTKPTEGEIFRNTPETDFKQTLAEVGLAISPEEMDEFNLNTNRAAKNDEVISDINKSFEVKNEEISLSQKTENEGGLEISVAGSDTTKQSSTELTFINSEHNIEKEDPMPQILISDVTSQKSLTSHVTIEKATETLGYSFEDLESSDNKEEEPGIVELEEEKAILATKTPNYRKNYDDVPELPVSSQETSPTLIYSLMDTNIKHDAKPTVGEIVRKTPETDFKHTLDDVGPAISPAEKNEFNLNTNRAAKDNDEVISDINKSFEVNYEETSLSQKTENEGGLEISVAGSDTTKQSSTEFTLTNSEYNIENAGPTPQILISDVTPQKSSTSQVTIEKATETLGYSFEDVEPSGNKGVEPGLVQLEEEKSILASKTSNNHNNYDDVPVLPVSSQETSPMLIYSLKDTNVKHDTKTTKGEIVRNTPETDFKHTLAEVGLAISPEEKDEFNLNTNRAAKKDKVISDINKSFEVKNEEISLSQKTENEGGLEISVAGSDTTKQSSTELTFINSEHNIEKEDPTPQILISDVTSQKSLTSQVTIEKATETLGYSFEDLESSDNKEEEPGLVELEEEKAIPATKTPNYHKNYDDVPELPVSSPETSPTLIYSLKDTNIKHDAKPTVGEIVRNTPETDFKHTLDDVGLAISPEEKNEFDLNTNRAAKDNDEVISDINKSFEVNYEETSLSQKTENEGGLEISVAGSDTTKQSSTEFTLTNSEHNIENEGPTPQILVSDVTPQKSSTSQVTIEKATETLGYSFEDVQPSGNKGVEPGQVQLEEEKSILATKIAKNHNNYDGVPVLPVSSQETSPMLIYSLKDTNIKHDTKTTKGEIVRNTPETDFKQTLAEVGLAISPEEKDEFNLNNNRAAKNDDEVVSDINKSFEVNYEETSLSQKKTENEGGLEISVAGSDTTMQSSTELTFINSEHNIENEDPTPQILISDDTSQKSSTSQVTNEKASKTVDYSYVDKEPSGNKEVEPGLATSLDPTIKTFFPMKLLKDHVNEENLVMKVLASATKDDVELDDTETSIIEATRANVELAREMVESAPLLEDPTNANPSLSAQDKVFSIFDNTFIAHEMSAQLVPKTQVVGTENDGGVEMTINKLEAVTDNSVESTRKEITNRQPIIEYDSYARINSAQEDKNGQDSTAPLTEATTFIPLKDGIKEPGSTGSEIQIDTLSSITTYPLTNNNDVTYESLNSQQIEKKPQLTVEDIKSVNEETKDENLLANSVESLAEEVSGSAAKYPLTTINKSQESSITSQVDDKVLRTEPIPSLHDTSTSTELAKDEVAKPPKSNSDHEKPISYKGYKSDGEPSGHDSEHDILLQTTLEFPHDFAADDGLREIMIKDGKLETSDRSYSSTKHSDNTEFNDYVNPDNRHDSAISMDKIIKPDSATLNNSILVPASPDVNHEPTIIHSKDELVILKSYRITEEESIKDAPTLAGMLDPNIGNAGVSESFTNNEVIHNPESTKFATTRTRPQPVLTKTEFTSSEQTSVEESAANHLEKYFIFFLKYLFKAALYLVMHYLLPYYIYLIVMRILSFFWSMLLLVSRAIYNKSYETFKLHRLPATTSKGSWPSCTKLAKGLTTSDWSKDLAHIYDPKNLANFQHLTTFTGQRTWL